VGRKKEVPLMKTANSKLAMIARPGGNVEEKMFIKSSLN